MQQSKREVVILKPTSVFLSFLASQLPEIELPNIDLLKIDTTAYTIPKHEDEEETLDEIERHFPTMFRHEICRWLGDDARNEIEGSFLDFLCCFKFEMHSQIVLMESSLEAGNQLLCIKPRSVLLRWMKSTVEGNGDLETVLNQVTLSHLTENATVIVKNFPKLSGIQPFVNQYYQPMFKAEMMRMSDRPEHWPQVDSIKTFNRYFSVEIHTQLVHLH